MFKRLFRKRDYRGRAAEAAYELVPQAEAERGRGFALRRVSDGRLVSWSELEEHDEALTGFQVAGAMHHSDALQDPAFAPGSLLQLIPETDDPNDPNAVSVWDIGQTHHIGYVPRERAPEIRRALRSGERLLCLSLWEEMESDRRVGLRALVVGDSVSLRSVR